MSAKEKTPLRKGAWSGNRHKTLNSLAFPATNVLYGNSGCCRNISVRDFSHVIEIVGNFKTSFIPCIYKFPSHDDFHSFWQFVAPFFSFFFGQSFEFFGMVFGNFCFDDKECFVQYRPVNEKCISGFLHFYVEKMSRACSCINVKFDGFLVRCAEYDFVLGDVGNFADWLFTFMCNLHYISNALNQRRYTFLQVGKSETSTILQTTVFKNCRFANEGLHQFFNEKDLYLEVA